MFWLRILIYKNVFCIFLIIYLMIVYFFWLKLMVERKRLLLLYGIKIFDVVILRNIGVFFKFKKLIEKL